MAWGKELTKDEAYKALGLTEQEILDLKAKAAKVDTLEQENTRISSEVNTVRESLAALEGRITTPTTNTQNNNSSATPTLTGWDEDPEQAFAQRTAPVAALAMDVRAKLNFREVTDRLVAQNPVYAKLSEEVRKMLEKEAPNVRAHEPVIENAYKIAFANNYEQIQKDQATKSGKYFMESGTNQTVRVEETPTQGLSAADKEQATKFGLSEDAYLKAKQSLNYVR